MRAAQSWRSWFAIGLVLLMTACAALPQVERPASYAYSNTADTKLGRALASQLALHRGESGFYPLLQGVDAFTARIAMTRDAQKSLDLQYYIYHEDTTGMVLLGELLAAAERGVRVRMLLDDVHAESKDEVLAILDSHPNIEVRLFNPFANRNARWIDFLGDFSRINRRMHNKSMTADNQVTIVGGRNIGDEYFSAKSDVDFSDLDLFAIGPIVKEVSKSFDDYWNSSLAYPASAFADVKPDKADFQALRARIDDDVKKLRDTPYVRALEQTDLAKQLGRGGPLPLYWGKARVIVDPPEKMSLPPERDHAVVISKLATVLDQAQKELILVSPYFIPGADGVRWIEGMVKRGVQVTVITNSFAATDVSAVHAGYTAYRKKLLKAGVKLYEMKPIVYRDKSLRGRQLGLSGSSRSSLHAKAYMMDRRVLFVGSLNLDGRSVLLNTELGVVLESEALCKALYENAWKELVDVSYRVQLVRDQYGDDEIVWDTHEEGRDVRFDSEPGMGMLDHFMQGVLKLLPVEDQL
jgi:putative cardiolipin synthase